MSWTVHNLDRIGADYNEDLTAILKKTGCMQQTGFQSLTPLIELEQCVAESFYIKMLATYPRFRGQGVGTALMAEVDRLALAAQCELISIAVFADNPDALALYQRLGYETIERRAVIACDYHPATEVLLLTKAPTAT